MTRQEVEKLAFDTMSSGLNCAETVLQVTASLFEVPTDGLVPRVATCFGGGLGRCQDELCGALAGGAMALGLLYGRDRPGGSCETAHTLAASLRQQFIERHGSSTCRALLARFGEQENWSRCKELVAVTAGMLLALVEAEQTGRQAAQAS
jgi:C_GCAxxG_C_C family probable redox protein